MSNKLHNLFKPISASPYSDQLKDKSTYIEIAPCPALAPFVYCFWGTTHNIATNELNGPKIDHITPDGCMDIIIDIDYDNHKTSNIFCGVQNRSFSITSKIERTTLAVFAIRFYPWAVVLFSDNDMKKVKNNIFSTQEYFQVFKGNLEERLIDCDTIHERIRFTETFLLRKLNMHRMNNHFMNAVHKTLITKGHLSIGELSEHVTVSTRQIERLFKFNIGLSPKEFTNLIRYQFLWREIVYSRVFDVNNAIFKYGFSDQSHLINNFKTHHSMTPSEAKAYANIYR